jgi:hypothetical protein
MTRAGVLLVATLAAAALAPSARADFGAPAELESGTAGINLAADTDQAGTTTVLASGDNHGPRLYERRGGAAWSAATSLPGAPRGVAGPVLDAAGNGVLAVAWRVDAPRHYSGIAVALRDPGGVLGNPTQIVGDEAGGVRHPAIAVDGAGDALLAYNTDTRKNHLSLSGAIAIAHRAAGGAFGEPRVVDRTPSSAPVAAIARDGSGIVAWTHTKRVYAVSVATDGTIGKVKSFTPRDAPVGLVAAAGEDGAATIAWTSHHVADNRRTTRTRYDINALTRRAGHAFAAPRVVTSSPDFVRELAVATDEDGSMTVAWAPEDFGRDHSVGLNGITSSVVATSARIGAPLGPPDIVAERRGSYFGTPSVAAADGAVAITWGAQTGRRTFGVQAAVGEVGALGAAQTLYRTSNPPSYGGPPRSTATIGPKGRATVIYLASEGRPPAIPTVRLLAADGT